MHVLIVDDHALFRAGLRLLLQSIDAGARVTEVATGLEAAAAATPRPPPDLCLLDLHLHDEEGLVSLARLREIAPAMAVVVVSASEDARAVHRSIEAGAMGFIPKSASPAELSDALQQALAGRTWLPPALSRQLAPGPAPVQPLSPRQRQVLQALCRGLPTKLIARELALSEYTVKEYIAAIFQALGVHNRTEAVVAASRLGLEGSRVPLAPPR